MICIENKKDCCGCTACYNICPKNAITMQADEEGFLYPQIDKELCVECGLCEKVCPVQNVPDSNVGEKESYVLRTKNRNVLAESTSGGFVTPLACWVFRNNGVFCGVSYDKEFKVKHTFVDSEVKYNQFSFRGSKYVQSDLGDCFKKIKKYLEQKIIVCFVGTTCQVSGLKTFLGKDFDNLITVDLVCHGTPSPKLWEKYLKYQIDKYHSEIEKINFRNKTYGYHSGTMKIQFKNGKEYFGSARVDLMLKSFFKEISSRPSCYYCPFKTLERCSDFTIYDCWHASDLINELKDDDQGYTNVIVQSEKGKHILSQLQECFEIYPVDTQKAVMLDGIMILNAAEPHPKRNEYYLDLEKEKLNVHVQKFIPISSMDKVIEKSKKIIYKVGLYKILKKMK